MQLRGSQVKYMRNSPQITHKINMAIIMGKGRLEAIYGLMGCKGLRNNPVQCHHDVIVAMLKFKKCPHLCVGFRGLDLF